MKRLLELLVTSIVGVGVLVAIVMMQRPQPETAGSGLPVSPSATSAAAIPAATAGASSRTSSDLAPATPPEELPGPCLNHDTMVDRVSPTIETVGRASSTVVLGKVVEVGPGQWNTPTGAAPEEDDWDALHVMRLVRFEVETSVKGDAPADLVAWVQGGTIGCHVFRNEEMPAAIAVGQRFALFATVQSPSANVAIPALRANQLWRVDAKNEVMTPVQGAVPVSTFAAEARG